MLSVEAGVNQRELGLWVSSSSLIHCISHQEANTNDDVAPALNHVLNVGDEVGVGRGLSLVNLDTEFFLRTHQAVVARLVEGLVIKATGVRDHAGLDVGGGFSSRASGFAGLVGWCTFGGRATGCETQCCNGGQSAESHCLLHVFLLVEILLCPS